MAYFLVRRFIAILAILVAVSALIFAITEILPGDAAAMILGQRATPESLTALRAQLGLDQPLLTRYLAWTGGLLRGDWGESLTMRLPVGPLLLQRLRNSAVLAGMAWILSASLGIGLGVIAGLHRNRWPDRLISVGTVFFVGFPPFVVAVFLIVLFSLWLGWLPASSMIEADANPFQAFTFLILPTLSLTLGGLAEIARLTRTSLIDELSGDYMRTAIAKGLPRRVRLVRHALRNALLPTVSVLALNVGYLMSGAVLVESVFAYPGLGRLLLQAINQRDLPLLQGVALAAAAIYALANLAADIAYFLLNPRIRYS